MNSDEQAVKDLARGLALFTRRRLRQLVVGQLITAFFLIGAIGYVKHGVGQIQAERARNTRESCKRSNMQNAAIVGFVKNSPSASEASNERARKTFPQRDCNEVAKQQVKR